MSGIVVWTPETPSLGAAVAAVGVFDGVHLGHQTLVRDAVGLARADGVASVVVTFDRDPDQIVSPGSAAPQLLDLEDKLSLLSAQGPDTILVIPFDSVMAAMPPLVFLDEVLLRAFRPVATVVGYDFRFGHRAEGEVDTLVRYGREHGFTVVAHDLVSVDGAPVTSTRIRHLVAEGDVAQAAALLGRPHRVRGDVHHGRGGGAQLGTPTANLAVRLHAALPAEGVYVAWAHHGDARYQAGVSVGRAPTFPDARDVLEAHLIGFTGDLYGSTLMIEFVERIRSQRRFDSPVELAAQIEADLRQVASALGTPPS